MGSQVDQNQYTENSSSFSAESSPAPFSALNFSKRQPLQNITYLFPTNGDTRSIYDGRGTSSAVETRGFVEKTSKVGNKKRKPANLSHDGNISSSNLKKTIAKKRFQMKL